MSTAYSAFAAHVWQSTLFAALAGLLTLWLRRNCARARYWVWLAALVKFLVPFGLLVDLGGHLGRPGWATGTPAIIAPAISFVAGDPGQSSLSSVLPGPQIAGNHLPALLFGVWAIGFVAVGGCWVRRWMGVRADIRVASQLPIEIGIPVVSSPILREPAVFGVFRPALLLPERMETHLSKAEWEAILAHELCHVRCYDNLTAAIYMLVETIFWFHPMVWWMGRRLVAERERACDEEVLRLGSDPRVYAEGILKVCELYLKSPLDCMAGVTGADLRRRIRAIMTYRGTERMKMGKRVLLVAAGMVAIGAPILVGIADAPRLRAQATVTTPLAFDVASVKRNKNGGGSRLRYSASGADFASVPIAWIIGEAYSIPYSRISSSDPRIRDMFFAPTGTAYFYDIAAKADHPVPRDQIKIMLQTLLADRFKLTLHHESKLEPVYRVVGKNGAKLQESVGEGEPTGGLSAGGFAFHNTDMARFSGILSGFMGRPVVDQTGLKGFYDFSLKSEGTNGPVDKAALSDWLTSSIFGDIQKQLGLQLEADKAPIDYLLIDHVEQPSEN